MSAGTQLSFKTKTFTCMVLVLGACGGSPQAPATGAFPMTDAAGANAGMPGAAATSGSLGGAITAGASGTTNTAGKPALTAGSAAAAATGGTPAVTAGGGSAAVGGASPAAGSGSPTGGAGTAGAAAAAGSAAPTGTHAYLDPGKGEWEKVAEADVPSVCKLDVAKLKAAERSANHPWMIVRYGKYCWGHDADNFTKAEAYSTTKTLGALVTGIASYQTRMLERSGPKTGQLSDEDPVTHWLDSPSYNRMAKVAHVLGMVAHDSNLGYGQKSFAYDTVGSTQINSLGTMITNALKQDPERLGKSVTEFTQKFLYEPLGMKNSSWGGSVFAYTWSVDLKDMARVGVLINNYGMWAGERLVEEQWIYRQTHPSFEDSNTGFGYLTWLNSSSNFMSIDGVEKQGAEMPGTCAPVCIHKAYPHGVSEAKDCGYRAPATCEQKYDVGVWQAEGLQGQLIQGHRGLDMVIVARNAQPAGLGPGTEKQVWDALRGAVIAGDPMFKGDEEAFCKAYGSNSYAPDLK